MRRCHAEPRQDQPHRYSKPTNVAASATDIEYLRHLADFVWAGQPATDAALQSVTGRDIRTLEPSLSSRLVGGYRAVGEWSVDNRRLLEALRAAAT
mgnify:FL=1